MHILIVGEAGTGKSTLIRKLLEGLPEPCGFITKKEPQNERGEAGVYIHSPAAPRRFGVHNRVGICSEKGALPFARAFDGAGVKLLREPARGRIVLMDELGFLESEAGKFCAAVLRILDGPETVVAAVKPRDTAFLQAVRSHPNARCYRLNMENRDRLAADILKELLWADPESPLLALRETGKN